MYASTGEPVCRDMAKIVDDAHDHERPIVIMTAIAIQERLICV